MRIEPPPSLACEIGTTPAATMAADPPEDAPTVNAVCHGLWTAARVMNSVEALNPNSGSRDLPSTVIPVPRYCRV